MKIDIARIMYVATLDGKFLCNYSGVIDWGNDLRFIVLESTFTNIKYMLSMAKDSTKAEIVEVDISIRSID